MGPALRPAARSDLEVWSVDVSFGTIWEAIARYQPDSVAISEPGRDHPFALLAVKLELAQIRRLASGQPSTPQP